MVLRPLWTYLEAAVFPVPSTETLFNPYRDRHPDLDRPDAVEIRRANLRRYLAGFAERPPVLLLAEAPGPWGCRFSGVPLTSEAQLCAGHPLAGRPSGLREEPYGEYSAGIFWRVLAPFFPRFFVWNVVPFHPHRPGEPLSIRNPTTREVMACADLLDGLLTRLDPAETVAIGRKAELALTRLGQSPRYVRHPSQGGARRFEEGMRAFWREQAPGRERPRP